MKNDRMILVGAMALLLLTPHLHGPGLFRAVDPGRAEAQTHQHGKEPASAPKAPVPKTTTPAAMTGEEQPSREIPVVEIPVDRQHFLGVKTATVSVQPLQKTIRTVGFVEYDQRRLGTVNMKFEGWVEKLHTNYPGISVKKGDPIADIYSPELWATQQELINMVKWAKQSRTRVEDPGRPPGSSVDDPDLASMIDRDARTLVDAARQRLRLWDLSDEQIKAIEERETPFRTLTIFSPYSGHILQKNISQGQRIMAGERLVDIIDLSTVWVTADIYENELPLIKVGDRATIEIASLPGKKFPTRIDFINPVLEGETRTAKARFVLPNEGGRIKLQMFTNVAMTINLGRTLVAPAEAVIDTGVRKVAYVDKGDGNFEPREVVTGVATEKMVEIKAGLKAGEKIAFSANFLIDSEAKLKGVEPLATKPAPARARTRTRGK